MPRTLPPSALERANRLLAATGAAHARLLADASARETFGALLADVLSLTDSSYGFLGEVLHDERTGPYVQTWVHTDVGWDDATRRRHEEGAPQGFELRDLGAPWAAAISCGRPVVVSDLGPDPRAGGLPPSHGPLRCFLGLPVRHGEALVGLIGLANRPGGYDDALLELLSPLPPACGAMIEAYRKRGRRRESEAALRRSEERMRALFETAVEGIITIDATGRITAANPAAERLFGYAPDELLGQDVAVLMPEPHRHRHAGSIRQYLETGVARIIGTRREVEGCRRDGTTFPLSLSVNVMDHGAERSFVGVLTDMSDAKAAERKILEMTSRLRTLIQSMADGVLFETEDRRVLLANERYCRMFGIEAPPGFLVGQDCAVAADRAAEMFADPDRFLASTDRMLAGRRPVRGQELRLLDGRTFERDYTPVAEGADLTGHLWQYRDVSDRKQAESELREARDAAESASRLKSAFLAGMSHEIRTPMTAIIGYADLLLGRGASGESAMDVARQIRRNADHLLALLNDVLDISKIEAGQLEVHVEPCDLAAVLATVTSLVRPLAVERGLAFHVDVEGEVPASLPADPLRLRQILLNLATNAVKFTDEGRVRLVARFRPDTAGGGSGRLSIAVEDTGIGIPPDRLGDLFATFTQIHDARSGRRGGTGLGLAISRHLARAMGGDISIASVLGRGSSFTLELPVPDVGSDRLDARRLDVLPEPASPPVEPALLGGLRILVVEDNPAIRRIVEHFVRRGGAEVETAADGQAGVDAALAARAAGRAHHVIVMDMQMPVLDGYDAVPRLRSAGIATPVVALTAHAMAGDAERCLAVGCDAYATKPLEPASFLRILADLAGRA